MLDWLADHPTAHRRLLALLLLGAIAFIADSGDAPLWLALPFMVPGVLLEIAWTIRDARARARPPLDPPTS